VCVQTTPTTTLTTSRTTSGDFNLNDKHVVESGERAKKLAQRANKQMNANCNKKKKINK